MEMDLGFPDHLVGHRRLQLLLLIFTNPCEKTNHSRLTKCKNNQTLFGGNQNDKDKENFDKFCQLNAMKPCSDTANRLTGHQQ